MRVFVALLLVASAATAQFSADDSVLYANRGDDWYMAFDQVESSSTGQIGIAPGQTQSRTLVLDPPLTGSAALEDGGKVVFVLYYTGEAVVGGLVPVVLVGQIDVAVELRQGGTVIASGVSEDNLISNEVAEVRIEADAQVGSINAAAGNLEWFIEESGTATGALFLPDSGNGEWSRVEVPIASGTMPTPGGPEYVNLAASTVSLSVSFDEPTTKTVVYNWTNELDHLQVIHDIAVTNGSVRVLVTDAEGETVLDLDVDDDDAGELQSDDAAQGPWTIEIEYSGFTGSLQLQIGPSQGGTTTTTHGGSTSHPGTSASGSTTSGQSGTTTTSEDSPAAAVALLLVGLGVLAWRRRSA